MSLTRPEQTRLIIKPDIELLNLMKDDYKKTDAVWKATKTWQPHVDRLFEYFSKSENVVNFRCSTVRTGISTQNPNNDYRIFKPTGKVKILVEFQKRIPLINKLIYFYEHIQNLYIKQKETLFLENLAFKYLYIKEKSPEPILEDSMIGNPDDGIMIGDKYYDL